MTSETQRALLQVWADDIGHVVDLNNSPKAEFARLEKAKGWIGGSPDWCYHWEKCFSETYSWGVHIKSLDELSGSVEILNYDQSISMDVATDDGDTGSNMSGRENPVWNDFTDFVHHPNAPFKEEFERLARIKGWDRRTKRQNLITLLRTEVEFYWSSNDVDKLECYQYLCREMGIEQIPCTVTQARKALRPLKVNLYSVIDHMRNPKTRIITYKTMRELRLSVRKIGTFPRDCAKAGGGYMATLLSKL
ncbi:unnamed protein product [Alternaria alternata]